MKQFMLFLALIGLAATGCTHTRVLGTHARRGGADMKIVRQQTKPRTNVMKSFFTKSRVKKDINADSDIQLASYGGGRCRPCCAKPRCDDTCCDDTCCDDTCCDDTCCDDTCCDDSCCGDCCDQPCCGCDDQCCGGSCCADTCCGDGCCGDGCCGSGCCGCDSGGAGNCSACGGNGCGLCQRMVGRIASGCCPHKGGYPEAYNYNPSPPSGQVAYPYYTVRGPRDFLRNNPPSIGPY
ncbi:MAG: hypothetical protein ACR2NM_13435 [Bythopirellula sp.]